VASSARRYRRPRQAAAVAAEVRYLGCYPSRAAALAAFTAATAAVAVSLRTEAKRLPAPVAVLRSCGKHGAVQSSEKKRHVSTGSDAPPPPLPRYVIGYKISCDAVERSTVACVVCGVAYTC
jgi:hypothetical protein